MASEKKQGNKKKWNAPYERTLRELVQRLPDQSFRFVIAISILLIGLTVLASAVGAPDLRFIVIVIACLAFVVIIGFFIKLGRVETRQSRQELEIAAIQIALKGILTKHEMGPLERLNDPKNEKVLFRWEPELYGYLHRLDGIGFIQPQKDTGLKYGLYDIEEDHRHEGSKPYHERPEFDLRKYVYITHEGKEYLNILR